MKLLALALLAVAMPAVADDRAAFESLTALEGTWRPADKPNSKLRVTFEATAGGSVLVETWRAAAPHSMTVYHLDGGTLLATHYCPQGNVPRLALVRTEADGTLRFEFRDGANTDVAGGHHEAVLTLRHAEGTLTRGETYAENARPFDPATAELELTAFERVATP